MLKELIQKEFTYSSQYHPELVRSYATEIELAHGRLETRSIEVLSTPPNKFHFPEIRQIGKIVRTRENAKTGKRECETVYLITSHTSETLSAQKFLEYNRAHWQVENKLHYVLDDTYREDRMTMRKGAGPKVMASLRTLAVSLLRIAGVENIKRAVDSLKREAVHVAKMVAWA